MASPIVQTHTVGSNTDDTQNVTVNKPSGTVEGDLMLALLVKDGTETWNVLSGWTAVIDNIIENGRASVRVLRKTAGASEGSDYTFTWTGVNQRSHGTILRITGFNSGSPIDVTGTNTGTTISPTAPDVTTTVNDTLIVRYFGSNGLSQVDTGYPASHTGVFSGPDNGGGTGRVGAGAAHEDLATAGMPGTGVFTLSGSEEWSATTVAIEPLSQSPVPIIMQVM